MSARIEFIVRRNAMAKPELQNCPLHNLIAAAAQ